MIIRNWKRMAPDAVAGGAAVAPAASPIIVEDSAGVLDSMLEGPPIVEEEAVQAAGPSAAELQALYEKSQSDLAAMRAQQEPLANLNRGFEAIQRGIADAVARPVQVQAPPPAEEDYAQIEQDLDQNILEKPSAKIGKFVSRQMAPAFDAIMQSNVAMAKIIVAKTSPVPEQALFSQYEKEIEDEFQRTPPQERARNAVGCYERAFSVVKGRHIDEILTAKMAQQAASAASAASTAAPAAPEAPRTPAAASLAPRSSPMAPPAGQEGRKIVIPAGATPLIKQEMERMGIHESNFADYVEVLAEQGQLGRFKRA